VGVCPGLAATLAGRPQVSGYGPVDGLAAYIRGVKAVCTAFPDYHWDLQEPVVEEDTIAARLIGQGTHTGPFSGIAPTDRKISTQELVMYRLADSKIVQCWGDLFPVVRDALMTSARSRLDPTVIAAPRSTSPQPPNSSARLTPMRSWSHGLCWYTRPVSTAAES
jgi:predicted ester cyclase